ncbi:hypothetical protein [Phaeovulum sp. W22_SRMD_FR3]|uniref:hypothetical protein n=1 Tax=Phaeovulum sp. W22_SRMD_FR3 TaxID=3240274 RepID=UPI003F9B3A76
MRSLILLGAAALTLGTALSTVQAAPLATPLTTPAPRQAEAADSGARRYAEAEDDGDGVLAPLWQILHREGRHAGDDDHDGGHDGGHRRGHHDDDDDEDEGGEHGGRAQPMMNPNAPLPQKGIFANGIRPKAQMN